MIDYLVGHISRGGGWRATLVGANGRGRWQTRVEAERVHSCTEETDDVVPSTLAASASLRSLSSKSSGSRSKPP